MELPSDGALDMDNARAVRLLAIGLVVAIAVLTAVIAAWGARSTGADWPDVLQRAGLAFGGTVGVSAALVALYRAIGGGGGG